MVQSSSENDNCTVASKTSLVVYFLRHCTKGCTGHTSVLGVSQLYDGRMFYRENVFIALVGQGGYR